MIKRTMSQIMMQPRLLLAAHEHNRLSDLAEASLAQDPSEDAQLLLDEVTRADTLPADAMPSRVVAMHSYVEYRDERTGTIRRVQLVYPHQAKISEGRISVLSLVGAALIGLAEGDAITCLTRDRGERRFTVLRVSATPFAEKHRTEPGRTGHPRSRRRRVPSAAAAPI
ncbi:MAG: nucleoside diphosphate kinase regulator [Acetobacteraceae bacterium]